MTPTINAFGLGIGDNNIEPFYGSDFHMPAAWTGDGPGSLPSAAAPGMPFLVFGDGCILAMVLYVGYSHRDHRWEHRPTEATGRREDAGPGWVLDLDPNTWVVFDPPLSCDAAGQSYRYGHFDSDSGRFEQIVLSRS